MIETAELLLDGVQIEERLGGMLPRPVAGAEHRHLRDARHSLDRSDLRVPQHDRVGVARDHLDRVLERLALRRRRRPCGILGAEHLASKPVHGGFEREAGPSAGLVEQRRQQPAAERRTVRTVLLERRGAFEQLLDQGTVEVVRAG